jgi:hypothetical protein
MFGAQRIAGQTEGGRRRRESGCKLHFCRDDVARASRRVKSGRVCRREQVVWEVRVAVAADRVPRFAKGGGSAALDGQ